MDGSKIILPMNLFDGTSFNVILENFPLNIFNFIENFSQTLNRVNLEIYKMKQQSNFNNLLDNYSQDLFYVFNSKYQLVFQNKEVPLNLKEHIESELIISDKDIGLNEIFYKNKELLQSIKNSVDYLNKSFENYKFCNIPLNFDVLSTIDENRELQEFVVLIHSQQGGILKILKRDSATYLENEKIQRSLDYISSLYNIPESFSIEEIVSMMKNKFIENQITKKMKISSWIDYRNSVVREYYNEEAMVKEDSFKTLTDVANKRGSRKASTLMNPSNNSNVGFKLAEVNLTSNPEIFVVQVEDLEKLQSWDFNILEVTEMTEKLKIVFAMFKYYNFFEKYEVNIKTFGNFLGILSDKYSYRNNPFHNFDHGVTVTHAIFHMMKFKLMKTYIPELERYSLLLAALCHDVDHTGKNNSFESSSLSKLSLRYNDESVLENHHASTTFKILSQDKYNIFQNVTEKEWREFRKYIISNIISTDMKKHFDLLKSFEIKSREIKEDVEVKIEADRKVITGTIVHCADLYAPTKNFSLSRIWASRINQEFMNQVKVEMEGGLPVTSFMMNLDDEKVMAKQEMGFINIIVKPLWSLINTFLDGHLDEAVKNCEMNYKKWESIKNGE